MLVELDKRDFRSVARFSEAYIADYRDLFAASRPQCLELLANQAEIEARVAEFSGGLSYFLVNRLLYRLPSESDARSAETADQTFLSPGSIQRSGLRNAAWRTIRTGVQGGWARPLVELLGRQG